MCVDWAAGQPGFVRLMGCPSHETEAVKETRRGCSEVFGKRLQDVRRPAGRGPQSEGMWRRSRPSTCSSRPVPKLASPFRHRSAPPRIIALANSGCGIPCAVSSSLDHTGRCDSPSLPCLYLRHQRSVPQSQHSLCQGGGLLPVVVADWSQECLCLSLGSW